MNTLLPTASCCVAALLLSSCSTGQPPSPTAELSGLVPANWSQATASDASIRWIESFEDRALMALIDEAQARNFGLESAAHQVRAAEAAARINASLRYPSVGAGIRSSRSENLASFAPPTSVTTETHSLNLSASWELDLWNRLGDAYSAARSQYQATRFEYEALKLSLASQVAKAWFNATEAKLQYELSIANAESYETNLNTLERRYSRGLVDAFDLRLTRAQAAASRASAISRRNQMDTSIRILEILLGHYPAAAIETAENLPELSDPPGAGIPAMLLSRRPDILAQENRLAAAIAQESAARKNWLPSILLTGSGGTLSSEFSNLLDSDFTVWSLAGDVAASIFQGGRLKAERQQLSALQMSQVARYKDIALRAFREVESALRAETDLRDLAEQTAIAAAENLAAKDQAWNLYERGLVDITAVLDAERRSFDARSQLISIQNQRLQNRVDLHIALGGDF